MAYNSEFDKVHYPLPLNFEENTDNLKFKQTIQKLKDEQDVVKSGKVLIVMEDFGTSRENFSKSKENQSNSSITEQIQMRDENEILKAKVRRLEEASNQKIGAIEMDNIIRDKNSLQQETQQLKLQMQKDNSKFLSDLQEKNKELVLKTAEITAFKKELTNLVGREDADKKIQSYIQAMDFDEESQVLQQKKIIQKLEKDIERLNQFTNIFNFRDCDQFKKLDQKQRQRIKQLEVELETSMKKFSHKGITDRLYSPFSNQSNGSKKSNYSAPNKGYNQIDNINRVSPNSSKNSFNSRNSSQNQASQAKNKSYNNSPGYKPNAYLKKPQSGANQNTPPQRVIQPQNKVQSATTRGIVSNRYSPTISRSPQLRQNIPNRNNPQQNKTLPNNNRSSPIQRPPPQKIISAQRQPQNYKQPLYTQQRNGSLNNRGNNPSSYVKPEFNDTHLNSKQMVPRQQNELDNKINNLRNLLQQAKK